MAYILEWITYLNQIVSENISTYLPNMGIFTRYPLFILIIFFILTAGFALFVDFIKDAWKIPIAIIGDILDIVAMQYPGIMDSVAALYSVLIFYVLASNPEFYKHLSAFVGGVECFIGINFPFPFMGGVGKITNILPTNTVLMIVATVID